MPRIYGSPHYRGSKVEARKVYILPRDFSLNRSEVTFRLWSLGHINTHHCLDYLTLQLNCLADTLLICNYDVHASNNVVQKPKIIKPTKKLTTKTAGTAQQAVIFCLVFAFMSAGKSVWLWGWRRLHVVTRASLPHFQLSGVWRAALHDTTELHRVGHHERTQKYVRHLYVV